MGLFRKPLGVLRALAACFLLAGYFVIAPAAQAQWLTQSFELKGGWNAVFFHVDATHTTIDDLILSEPSNPIQEIWLWQPAASTLQFITSPQEPSGTGTQWANWLRGNAAGSTLQRLPGNAAYLVRLSAGVTSFTWNIKGKPVPPRYQWTSTGLNFLGFPTPPASPPDFEALLAGAQGLPLALEIYQYPGGDLGPNNPARVFNQRTTLVKRGQAFWIRAPGVFNRYFGPIEVHLQNASGVNFRDSISQSRIIVRNLHSSQINFTLNLVASEAPPAGQSPIVASPPLLVRGALDPSTLTYGFTILADGPVTRSLAPRGRVGSEVEIVLGLNRSQLTAAAGSQYSAVLRLTDSLNFSQVDIPVSAVVASTAGLWVGEAKVRQVRHYLKTYERDPDGKPVLAPSPAENPANAPYNVTGVNTSFGAAAREFPLRLIIHNSAASGAVLLQRVYHGPRLGNNFVLATRESLLDAARLDSARRISAAHLPFSAANVPWAKNSGELRQGANLVFTVALSANDQAANPFVHTYHPDHDNLDVDFKTVLPQGVESFRVERQITLAAAAPAADFASLTSGGLQLAGNYGEVVTFFGRSAESRQFEISGTFVLHQISSIGSLTTE